MGRRLTRIVTHTGDDGSTGLGDGSRVAKASARIEAIGAVDELNSALAVLLALPLPGQPPTHDWLIEVQHHLFDLGGELAVPGLSILKEAQVEEIERRINELNAALPPLAEFVLPGGGAAASACHMARAICRRAERRCWALGENASASLRYLNRLSDLLFVLARHYARAAHNEEVLWRHRRGAD